MNSEEKSPLHIVPNVISFENLETQKGIFMENNIAEQRVRTVHATYYSGFYPLCQEGPTIANCQPEASNHRLGLFQFSYAHLEFIASQLEISKSRTP